MKVMVIHHGDEAGNALVERVRSTGVEVVEQAPRWPHFFMPYIFRRRRAEFRREDAEKPDMVVVECSTDPSVGREVGGYIGETGLHTAHSGLLGRSS